MQNPPDMLGILTEACVATVFEHNEFWVLASLTDWSYEEGTRNKNFRYCVDIYKDAGVPEGYINQLHMGINGNLCNAYQQRLPAEYTVIRNKGKGQDLTVYYKDMAQAKIESKLIYDLTNTKYYTSTANDFQKLQSVRSVGFPGSLFLVVYFVQMPNHDYRACLAPEKDRRLCPGTRGIRNQYQLLKSKLTVQPVWPLDPPHIEDLAWSHNFEELKKWHTVIFEPTSVWSFETGCLTDAKVGIAIWQCP